MQQHINPLTQANNARGLGAIREEPEPRTDEGSMESGNQTPPDPFNQRLDSTHGMRATRVYSHYGSPATFQSIPCPETLATSPHHGHDMQHNRPVMEYFRRLRDAVMLSSEDSEKGDSPKRTTKSQRAGCLVMTNRVLQCILMILGIVMVFGTLIALGQLVGPTKGVMLRVSHILGENSIELHNVTITSTKMEGILLPNMTSLLSSVFGDNDGGGGGGSLGGIGEAVEAVVMETQNLDRTEAIELKDAKVQRASIPSDDPFTNWCQTAPCTSSLRDRCPALGKALDEGQRDGIPVIPFPRDFCEAVEDLNGVGCLCDKNVLDIPGAERLVKSSSLVSMMCGFRDELQTCD